MVVTGGIMSGLGKGITASSIAVLLQVQHVQESESELNADGEVAQRVAERPIVCCAECVR